MEKFHELWIMNEERCKEMAQKLLDADRIIFEQQLGLTWIPSDLNFMNNIGPIDATKIPKPSIDVVREILIDENENDNDNDNDDENSPKQSSSQKLSNLSMKSILELLCDEGEFLVEPKLLALLEPLESNEKSLIKLDAIFRALKIENEDDIKIMAKHFIDHIQLSNDQQTKVYVSSGTGPEQVEETEVKIFCFYSLLNNSIFFF